MYTLENGAGCRTEAIVVLLSVDLRYSTRLRSRQIGEKICVVQDDASYFTANAVQEFVKDTAIDLCYLPRGSAPVNPAGECWKKLNQALGNRLFDTLDELRGAALAALDRINPPSLFTYLWP